MSNSLIGRVLTKQTQQRQTDVAILQFLQSGGNVTYVAPRETIKRTWSR